VRTALAEYTEGDQGDQTLGRDLDRAITEVRNEYATICGLLAGIDWRALLVNTSDPRPRVRALRSVANHLRDPRTAGNTVEPASRPSGLGSATAPPGWNASMPCVQ
jgi:type I restriction enzyme R subunit